MIQFLQQISCQEGKDKKGTNRDLKDIYFTKKKKKTLPHTLQCLGMQSWIIKLQIRESNSEHESQKAVVIPYGAGGTCVLFAHRNGFWSDWPGVFSHGGQLQGICLTTIY